MTIQQLSITFFVLYVDMQKLFLYNSKDRLTAPCKIMFSFFFFYHLNFYIYKGSKFVGGHCWDSFLIHPTVQPPHRIMVNIIKISYKKLNFKQSKNENRNSRIQRIYKPIQYLFFNSKPTNP